MLTQISHEHDSKLIFNCIVKAVRIMKYLLSVKMFILKTNLKSELWRISSIGLLSFQVVINVYSKL